jgi:hypothetical protein
MSNSLHWPILAVRIGSGQSRYRFPTSYCLESIRNIEAAIVRIRPGFIDEIENRLDPAARRLRRFHVDEAPFIQVSGLLGDRIALNSSHPQRE